MRAYQCAHGLLDWLVVGRRVRCRAELLVRAPSPSPWFGGAVDAAPLRMGEVAVLTSAALPETAHPLVASASASNGSLGLKRLHWWTAGNESAHTIGGQSVGTCNAS
eukprot:8002368-Pyramimonas_sp.AAC.1